MRILSAASTSSARLPPAPTAATPGTSFHLVLANASTEGGPDTRSTENAAETQFAKSEDHGVDEKEPTGSNPRGGGDADGVDGTGGESWAATSQATQMRVSAAPAAATGNTGVGIDLSAVTLSSGNGDFRQGIVDALVSAAGTAPGAVGGPNGQAANGATVRTPGKQDRSKRLTESKDTSAPTAVISSVVDLSKVAIATMASWHLPAHSEPSETLAGPAKDSSTKGSAGIKGKPSAMVGTTDAAVGTATASDGTAGVEQSGSVQSPGEVFVAGLDLPATISLGGVSGIVGNVGGGLESGKPMLKGAAATDDSGNLAPGDGASGAKSLAGGGLDPSTHGVANETQTALNPQGDSLKNVEGPLTPRAAESAATQAPLQAIAHQSATSQPATPADPGNTHAAKEQDPPAGASTVAGDAIGASGINSAKLIQTLGSSEMHVGMHSEEFGNISIRTSLSEQQMVTQISLDHNDLSQAISSHLSTMQAKLGEEYGLHASIEINNQGSALSSGHGESSQRDQQAPARSNGEKAFASAELGEISLSVVAVTGAGSGHGLDIRI